MACSLFDRSIGHVVSLQDLCLLTVSGYLSSSNVWSIHRLVSYVHCKRIEHIVHLFICDNFMDISHTDQFLALDEKEMHWLLDNQDIKISEAAMLDSLARWYKHDEKQRESTFKQLFDKIHLNVIGKDVLSAVIKKYQLVKVIPGLRKYKKLLPQRENLDDLIYQENISSITVTCSPRKSVRRDLEFISWMPFLPKKGFKCFIKDIDIFHKHSILFEDKVHVFGIAAISQQQASQQQANIEPVYVSVDFHSQNIKEYAQPSNFTATQLNRKPAYVTCGIYLFVFSVARSEEFDIKNYIAADIKRYRARFDSLGTTEGLCKTVLQYNCVTEEWRELAPTLYGHPQVFPRDNAVMLSYKSRYLYIFGYHCEMYDMLTNTWKPLTSPWEGHRVYCHSGYVLGNKIYVVAQVSAEDEPGSAVKCFVYNIAESSWEQAVLEHEPEHIRSIYSHGPAKDFFGNKFTYSSCFSYNENDHDAMYLHRYHTISEVNISDTETGQYKISLNKKLDFWLNKHWEVFDMSVLTRGLQLLALYEQMHKMYKNVIGVVSINP